jgi:hypothetical protein
VKFQLKTVKSRTDHHLGSIDQLALFDAGDFCGWLRLCQNFIRSPQPQTKIFRTIILWFQPDCLPVNADPAWLRQPR